MSWLRCPTPRPWATVRLICFPHAGGSAVAYRSWAPSPAVEVHAVQYPGRADRIRDPFVTDARQMAKLIVAALAPLQDRPMALFGHSMGALVAYETALLLESRGTPPVHLFVSGTRPPHFRGDREKVSTRTDEGVMTALDELGGSDMEAMRDPELRELVMPYIRADFKLVEDYEHVPGAGLTIPVTTLIGDEDSYVNAGQAARWAEVTTGPFGLKVLPGGHFYLVPQQADVLAEVLGHLNVPV